MQKYLSTLLSNLFGTASYNSSETWHQPRSDEQLREFVERRLALSRVPIEIDE